MPMFYNPKTQRITGPMGNPTAIKVDLMNGTITDPGDDDDLANTGKRIGANVAEALNIWDALDSAHNGMGMLSMLRREAEAEGLTLEKYILQCLKVRPGYLLAADL